MKITKRQLRSIIREEKQRLLNEGAIETLEAEFSGMRQLALVLDDVNKGNANPRTADELYDAILWGVDEVLQSIARDIQYKAADVMDDESIRKAFSDAFEITLRDM